MAPDDRLPVLQPEPTPDERAAWLRFVAAVHIANLVESRLGRETAIWAPRAERVTI